jgi:hypothetical protein
MGINQKPSIKEESETIKHRRIRNHKSQKNQKPSITEESETINHRRIRNHQSQKNQKPSITEESETINHRRIYFQRILHIQYLKFKQKKHKNMTGILKQ